MDFIKNHSSRKVTLAKKGSSKKAAVRKASSHKHKKRVSFSKKVRHY